MILLYLFTSLHVGVLCSWSGGQSCSSWEVTAPAVARRKAVTMDAPGIHQDVGAAVESPSIGSHAHPHCRNRAPNGGPDRAPSGACCWVKVDPQQGALICSGMWRRRLPVAVMTLEAGVAVGWA